MDKLAKFQGESARALKTPEGQIKRLDIAMASMRRHIGEASLEARAKLASTWADLLPEIEPFLIAAKKLSAEAMISVAKFIRKYGVPALKAISAWAAGPGAEAWNRMKAAWSDMAGKIGTALGAQFDALAGKGRNFGDVVVSAMDGLTAALKWIGDNASWLIPTLEGIAVAFGLMAAVSFITLNASMWELAAAVGFLGGVFGKTASEWKKFQDLQEGKAVSDPEHFTKHWYLMGQTWTETFAGLTGIVQAFQEGWDKSIDELKAKWDWLVESIRLFKMPAWWDKFWANQAKEAKGNADALEAQRKIEEQADFARRAAYQPKVISFFEDPKETIAAANAVRATQAALLARPPDFPRRTAPRGLGDLLPGIQGRATTAEITQPFISGGTRGMPAVAGLQTATAEILPFWKRTTDNMGDDWRTTWAKMTGDTAQIQPGLTATGTNIQTQIITPIQQAAQYWSALATAMGTPLASLPPPQPPRLDRRAYRPRIFRRTRQGSPASPAGAL